jgi:uncharacterized protein
MRVFERAGAQNTDETLQIAVDAARQRGLPLVVASTRGPTAQAALARCQAAGVRLIVVTHNVGFAEAGAQELDPAVRRRLEEAGARVLTTTMPLRSIGTALRKLLGGSEQEIINAALRIFCQGAKVCVEMAAMVADAGLVAAREEIVAVAGTGSGADTACVMRPMPSNQLFEIRVRELLCKPGEY